MQQFFRFLRVARGNVGEKSLFSQTATQHYVRKTVSRSFRLTSAKRKHAWVSNGKQRLFRRLHKSVCGVFYAATHISHGSNSTVQAVLGTSCPYKPIGNEVGKIGKQIGVQQFVGNGKPRFQSVYHKLSAGNDALRQIYCAVYVVLKAQPLVTDAVTVRF